MADEDAQNVPEIEYPRHILLIGSSDSGVLPLLKDISGSAPTPRNVADQHDIDTPPAFPPSPRGSDDQVATLTQTTTAGLSHQLELKTRYYRATIPIWIDETDDAQTWKTDFLSAEAAEVVKAVGAWIIVFRKTANGWKEACELMNAVRDCVQHIYGGEGVWDGVFLCIGMPAERNGILQAESSMGTGYDDWDDEAFEFGFEFVDCEVKGEAGKKRNAAGDLQGTARLIEALEANEWDNVDDLNESTLGLIDDDDEQTNSSVPTDETAGFRLERTQMEREFAGLKMAMAREDGGTEANEDDEAQQVEELERMMLKMHAVRDMSSHMPEHERKRLAKKTVDEIMKEIS